MFDLNLEIQLLLKQGQVEVDMGEFVPDFSDSILIHRSAIEELNNQIKVWYNHAYSFCQSLSYFFCFVDSWRRQTSQHVRV